MKDSELKYLPGWSDFVEYHGDESEAGHRLIELMRMDIDQPMPDQISHVDVSSKMDDKVIEGLVSTVKDHHKEFPDESVLEAHLIVRKVDLKD